MDLITAQLSMHIHYVHKMLSNRDGLTVKHENNASMKQMRPLRPFCRSQ